jgi:hypothetical protein
MKKVVCLLILVLAMFSCTIELHDSDGFRLFNFHDVAPTCYVIQSHDGYRVGDKLFHEGVFDPPVTVENVLDRPISVRITHENSQTWIDIEPRGFLSFGT